MSLLSATPPPDNLLIGGLLARALDQGRPPAILLKRVLHLKRSGGTTSLPFVAPVPVTLLARGRRTRAPHQRRSGWDRRTPLAPHPTWWAMAGRAMAMPEATAKVDRAATIPGALAKADRAATIPGALAATVRDAAIQGAPTAAETKRARLQLPFGQGGTWLRLTTGAPIITPTRG
jgi:hypothetical protein